MKPLFTIHAGEFVAGDFIERNFRHLNVWVPGKDKGIDLLVTDAKNKKSVSLQIKFSKDYSHSHLPEKFQKAVRAFGWWSLGHKKIASSVADYWVLVLMPSFERKKFDFVVTTPRNLLKRLEGIHGKPKTIQSYLWVTKNGGCWETRGLRQVEKKLIAQNQFHNRLRDFTAYLNNWQPLEKINR